MPAPLRLEVTPVHLALAPEAEQTTHVLLRVRAVTTAPARPRPRLTAVLVLDASGSMRGEPMLQVVLSAERLADILSDTDRLGVVAFNDVAVTISPLRELEGGARRELKREVAPIGADGGTNIGAALAHAALMFPKRAPGERQLMLVLSDGEPNIGAQAPAELAAQARLVKDREIAVSTLGYGASHNDDVL